LKVNYPENRSTKIKPVVFLERASRSALMKYMIYSLIYVSTTNIYWSI